MGMPELFYISRTTTCWTLTQNSMQKMFFSSVLLVACLSILLIAEVCQGLGSGYTLTSISQKQEGKSLIAQLQLIANSSLYGPDIQQLNLLVSYETSDTLRVYITDAAKPRWEIPRELVARYDNNSADINDSQGHELQFSYTYSPFGFAVTRNSTGEVLFNSSQGNGNPFGNMVFKDQYLEISTALPRSAALYGMGESTRPGFRLDSCGSNYTLWNSDLGSMDTYVDLYGSHPFYMDVRAGGVAHGVVLLNSNGMNVDYGGSYLTYRVTGEFWTSISLLALLHSLLFSSTQGS